MTQNLQLVSQNLPLSNSNQPQELLSSLFLAKVIDQKFIESIINVSLYQADFSTSSSNKPSDVIKFIDQFLFNISKDIKKLNTNIFNIPNSLITNSINLTRQILSLREDKFNKCLIH